MRSQELCRRHKTLLVMDEVQTGLGRTGKFFCYEHWELEPDIITVSKALSGGYVPVGAVLTIGADLHLRLQLPGKGSETLDHFRPESAGDGGRPRHPRHVRGREHRRDGRASPVRPSSQLAPLVERYEMFHEVRGKGLMIGLQFGPPTVEGLAPTVQHTRTLRPAIFSQMMVVPLFHRHRILTQVAADNVNIIKLLPALICGQEEIDYFVGALDDVLKDAHDGYGLFFEFGRTMAKGALRRSGRVRPDAPYALPPQNGHGAALRTTALPQERSRCRPRLYDPCPKEC